MNVDYDKLFDNFWWESDGSSSYKGSRNPYRASLSWPWPAKTATLLVYRHDVLVFAAQDKDATSLYNRVTSQVRQRERETATKYAEAFMRAFGKD